MRNTRILYNALRTANGGIGGIGENIKIMND